VECDKGGSKDEWQGEREGEREGKRKGERVFECENVR